LLLVVAVLVALVARRLAASLVLAAVLAGIIWPAHERLTRRLRGRRSASAAIWVVGVILVLLGPLIPFTAVVVDEVAAGVQFVAGILRSEGAAGILRRLPPSMEHLGRAAAAHLPARFGGDLASQASAQGARAAAAVNATVSATGTFLFRAAMMVVALFALLLDGDRLVAWIDRLSPLRKGQTRELLLEFKKTAYSVVVSQVITALVQAAAALVGYLIARVPHALFFTGVTLLGAFIPLVGAGSITLVAALLLYLTGHPHAALFLAVWAVLVVSLVDNLIKPVLMRAGMQMRGVLVFFALIGGAATFGPVGLLLGPLAVALFLALLRIYERDFRADPSA
jgi:predicted PurR-regulated permease PerM